MDEYMANAHRPTITPKMAFLRLEMRGFCGVSGCSRWSVMITLSHAGYSAFVDDLGALFCFCTEYL